MFPPADRIAWQLVVVSAAIGLLVLVEALVLACVWAVRQVRSWIETGYEDSY